MTEKSDMHMAGMEKMSDVGGRLPADEQIDAVANAYKFKEERQPEKPMSRSR
jgi:hypothetical protein